MVPVDVRVFDRSGRPVTDLTRDDFTVLEDGIPQEIVRFSTQALAADPELRRAGPLHRGAPGDAPAAANRRVFLLMLAHP
jgi:hypothetical protein